MALKLVRTLAIGHNSLLVPHIDKYQQKGNFPKKWLIEIENEKPWDPYFHPSGDCYTSIKTLYREKMKLEPSFKPSALQRRTFDCGHFWHRYIQNMLIEMEFVHPDNVERYTTYIINRPHGTAIGAGTGDLINVKIPGHGRWLVDIKSVTKDQFTREIDPLTFKKYTAQVNCYMDWFDADQAMILAVCKDSPHEMREFIIQRDQNLLDEIYDRWVTVANYIRNGTEPE